MNGCQYQQKTFTLPAGSSQITSQKWDLTFMSREEFMAKYKMSNKEYDSMIEFVKE